MQKLNFVAGIVCLFAGLAQGQDLERFHIEMTSGFWRLGSEGTLQSNGTAVDLKSDLGIRQDRFTFSGKLSLKKGRKHQFNIEAIPYRLFGQSRLSRAITYNGTTYGVQEDISTKADITYIAAGYQYNFLHRDQGHVGLTIDAGYLDATGSIMSLDRPLSATKSQKAPLPLIGGDFRAFLVPHKKILNVNGGVKGMSFGSYGHYVHGEGNVGVGIGPITVQAGYQIVDLNVHIDKASSTSFAMTPRFSGPVFSIQFRDR